MRGMACDGKRGGLQDEGEGKRPIRQKVIVHNFQMRKGLNRTWSKTSRRVKKKSSAKKQEQDQVKGLRTYRGKI